MWFLTINHSTKHDNIGVTDIGRRSLTPSTGVHLGTGISSRGMPILAHNEKNIFFKKSDNALWNIFHQELLL